MNTVKTVALFVVAAFATATPGAAQDCLSTVVDEAGIFKSSHPEVETAAARLKELGADVYVRTFARITDVRGGDLVLDNKEQALLRSCANWQMPGRPGLRKETLLTVMMSMQERKVGIYYGGAWTARVEPIRVQVTTQVMGPQFRSGNFARGFTLALNELATAIGRPITIAQPRESMPQTAPPVVVERQVQPTDFSGLWRVMGWVVAFLALAAIAFVAFFGYVSHTKRRGARASARAKRDRCAELQLGLEEKLGTMQALCASIAAQSDVEHCKDIETMFLSFSVALDEAILRVSSVARHGKGLDMGWLSADEYRQIEASYDTVLRMLEEASSLGNACQKAIDKALESAARADKEVESARNMLKTTRQAVERTTSLGFNTQAIWAAFHEAKSKLAEAEGLLKNKPILAARLAQECLDKSNLAYDEAINLPPLRASILKDADALEAQIERAKDAVNSGAKTFANLSDRYTKQTLDPIAGNGSRATAIINQALKALEESRRKAGMDVQDWDAATAATVDAREHIGKAETLMASLLELEASLNRAKEEIPAAMKSAEDDINRAVDYIASAKKRSFDISDGLDRKLEQARKVLREAAQELEAERPDHLDVMKLINRAHALADEALAGARNEQEAQQRLKEKAEAAMKSARSRVSKAREYIQDNRGDVKKAARNQLEEAQDALDRAGATYDLAQAIILYELADDLGKQSYADAHRNVKEATPIFVPANTEHESSRPSGSTDWDRQSSGGGGSDNWQPSVEIGGGNSVGFGDFTSGGGGGSNTW